MLIAAIKDAADTYGKSDKSPSLHADTCITYVSIQERGFKINALPFISLCKSLINKCYLTK
jgi:hypothetical protein